MRRFFNIVPLLLTALLAFACEKTIELELPEPREYLVVHGQIEPDSFAYVSLSRNSPYFDPINLQLVASLLVNGALVTVSADGIIDTLEPAFNFQHFTLFNYKGTKIRGEVGKSYTLRIQNADYDLEAVTTIPAFLPLDSLWHRSRADLIREAGQFQPTARDEQLISLYFRYPDPPALGNFVRAFTKRNSEVQWSSDFNSIYSDDLVNGQTVDFVLRRGKEAYLFNDSLTFNEFGYFERGDTIQVKWSAIDKAHYTFWLTINSARGGSGNPFATPTIVATNIRGKKGRGLGIWGGYGSLHYTYIAQP
ncbi:MAG: DUF4249 domain-containing protein [Sphingobacteriaceae bacterium]|nr:DUF4249 domain-containing protein [Sphingobacteriaceae bacterium]